MGRQPERRREAGLLCHLVQDALEVAHPHRDGAPPHDSVRGVGDPNERLVVRAGEELDDRREALLGRTLRDLDLLDHLRGPPGRRHLPFRCRLCWHICQHSRECATRVRRKSHNHVTSEHGLAQASIVHVARHRRDPLDPRTDRRVPRDLEPALARDVRVGVQHDVGEGRARPHEEHAPVAQLSLHGVERPVPRRHPLLEAVGERLRPARVRDPEAHDRDRRLVVVLLEEHPLEHLRALVSIVGHEPRAVGEVPEDCARLGEGAAVVQDQGRNTERRVLPAEQLGPVRTVGNVHVPALVRDPEVRKEQPNLVAVARDRAVVQEHLYAPERSISSMR